MTTSNNFTSAIEFQTSRYSRKTFIHSMTEKDVYVTLIYRTFRYVDYCRLEQPSDDIEFVLTAIAKRIGALMKGNNIILNGLIMIPL